MGPKDECKFLPRKMDSIFLDWNSHWHLRHTNNEPKSESREQSLLKSFFIKLKKKLILPYVAFRDIEQGTRNFH